VQARLSYTLWVACWCWIFRITALVYGDIANDIWYRIVTFIVFLGRGTEWADVFAQKRLEVWDMAQHEAAQPSKLDCLGPWLLNWQAVNNPSADLVSRHPTSPKIHKNPYSAVQGHPRSLLSVAIESPCTTSY